jgi:DNA-binding response OmpR family regulator
MLGEVNVPHGFSVLLVEDDVRLARLTVEYLEAHQLRVTHLTDGEAGLREALRTPHDVVVLDVMLPGRDGLSVCQELRRRSDVPVLMLTARGEEADRVMGLGLGADDYMVKPFSSRELVARLQSLVRRARGQVGPSRERLSVGPLVLDVAAMRATLEGEEVSLTAYEFSLLRALVQNAGRILERERLMELAGADPERAFDRSVDVHVSRLRQKLGPTGKRLLRTVRGAGYLFATEGEG